LFWAPARVDALELSLKPAGLSVDVPDALARRL
jgi:hypothetical protein